MKNRRRSKNRFKKRREEFDENGCRTDVEQLRINWFADEIQLRTNSRQDEQSNRNECAPHIPRNERRNGESTTCSIHRPSSPRVHRFPSPPSLFFLFLFQEDTSTIPRYERRGIDVVTRCLGSNSILPHLWWPLLSFVIISKNRIGKAMDR